MRRPRIGGAHAVAPEEKGAAENNHQCCQQQGKKRQSALRGQRSRSGHRVGGQQRGRRRSRGCHRWHGRRRLLKLLGRQRRRSRLNCARVRSLRGRRCNSRLGAACLLRSARALDARGAWCLVCCRSRRSRGRLVGRSGDGAGQTEILQLPWTNCIGGLGTSGRRVLRGRGYGHERQPGRQSSNRKAPSAPHVLPLLNESHHFPGAPRAHARVRQPIQA